MLYTASLHKEPPEVRLVKKVNRKFVLVGDTARANDNNNYYYYE